jgi:hypothetical protein
MPKKKPTKTEDTYGYKGWLNSDSFLKRAFSILGYMFVAQMIIQIPLMIIFFIIMMVTMTMLGVAGAAGEWAM